MGFNSNFQFCYISPINYLQYVPEDSQYHLILAHLLKDPTYAAFYKEKVERGDFVICDNSAFEFGVPIEAKELFDLILSSGVKPTFVVAPDYPNQPYQKTIDSAFSFVKTAQEYECGVMAVPQSVIGDEDGWVQCYKELSNTPEIEVIGMSILGIPNAFQSVTGTKDIAFNRLYATQLILNEGIANPYRHHHYLGLGDGPREILMQIALGLIDTCDSSSPIWHGIQGITYDESFTGLAAGKTKIPVDFHLPYTEWCKPDIKYNVQWIQEKLESQVLIEAYH